MQTRGFLISEPNFRIFPSQISPCNSLVIRQLRLDPADDVLLTIFRPSTIATAGAHLEISLSKKIGPIRVVRNGCHYFPFVLIRPRKPAGRGDDC